MTRMLVGRMLVAGLLFPVVAASASQPVPDPPADPAEAALTAGTTADQRTLAEQYRAIEVLPDPDPWEGFNRKIFVFNEFADRWLLKPVAKAYRRVTPDPLEQGIGNLFANLGDINVMLNNLFQAKFGDAASDGGRFLINTTVGVGGLFDVASRMGLVKHSEDFGQTLGYWGLDSGPYLVLPLLGPRTVRDGLGAIPDGYANPITYIDHDLTFYSAIAAGAVSTRAQLLDAEKLVRGDRYIFLRDAYLQRRQFLVRDGVIDDDFGDQEFDADW